MTKIYNTTQGDTWDSIALKFYNNEKMMHHLLEANPKYITIVVFSANIKLTIPELDASKLDVSSSDLPAWRR